jgi:hypothetical protein
MASVTTNSISVKPLHLRTAHQLEKPQPLPEAVRTLPDESVSVQLPATAVAVTVYDVFAGDDSVYV